MNKTEKRTVYTNKKETERQENKGEGTKTQETKT